MSTASPVGISPSLFKRRGGLKSFREYISNHDFEDESEACECCDLQIAPNSSPDFSVQIFRQASQLPGSSVANIFSKPQSIRLTPASYRLLSTETRAAIDKAIETKPVVLFMKGTPETPQCGFSRASIQILGLQGVDPNKFAAFNVLENEELRQGELQTALGPPPIEAERRWSRRSERILGLADDTPALPAKGVRRWL